MAGQIALALGAGLTSGLLYSAVLAGSPLAMLLFYLAPLPILIASLGWGHITAAVGALGAAIVAAVLLRADAGLYYLATCGAPAVWIGHLATLSRNDGPGGSVEWYPPGRIVAQTTVIACVLAAGAMVIIGPDAQTFNDKVRQVVEQMVAAQPELADEILGAGGTEAFATEVARLLLPATVTVWLVTMLANLWAAARVLKTSGRLSRPMPRFMTIEIPRVYAAVFGVCLVAILAPGAAGLIAAAAASVWLIAYMLVGLSVLHAATLGMSARTPLLAGLYFALIAFVFAGLVVAAVGITEPFHKIRARALAQRPPPGPD